MHIVLGLPGSFVTIQYMPGPPTIRPAVPDDAGWLSDLAMRSKAHWGYSPEFMESCRSELTVDPRQILSDEFDYVVAVDKQTIVGFYAIETVSSTDFELEALFVEPDRIGCGIGRVLVQHAVRSVAGKGGETLLIQGDPNATKFYLSTGARQIGTRESESISGRFLPLFQISIEPSR